MTDRRGASSEGFTNCRDGLQKRERERERETERETAEESDGQFINNTSTIVLSRIVVCWFTSYSIDCPKPSLLPVLLLLRIATRPLLAIWSSEV